MAEVVDAVPTFGAELKVRRRDVTLVHILPNAPMNLIVLLGWFQTGQCLGGQRHNMAQRYRTVLPGTKCDRERIQRKAADASQEVL